MQTEWQTPTHSYRKTSLQSIHEISRCAADVYGREIYKALVCIFYVEIGRRVAQERKRGEYNSNSPNRRWIEQFICCVSSHYTLGVAMLEKCMCVSVVYCFVVFILASRNIYPHSSRGMVNGNAWCACVAFVWDYVFNSHRYFMDECDW